MAASSPMSSFFLLLPLIMIIILASSSSSTTTVHASSGKDGGGLTHIRLYLHETFKGANATVITSVASPRGSNSSFGSVNVLDDELRVGRDRASELVGRFQGLIVGTASHDGAAQYLTSFTFVFTAGEYKGSTLSMQGPVLRFDGAIERALVGGTGKFRMARGYSLLKLLGNPTPATVLFELDLFVLMYRGNY